MSASAKDVFRQSVALLSSLPELGEAVSRTTIESELTSFVEALLDAQLSGRSSPKAPETVDALIVKLVSGARGFTYFFRVDAPRWPPNRELGLGNAKAYWFSPDRLTEVLRPLEDSDDPQKRAFVPRARSFMEHTLLNHLCVECRAYGDHFLSLERAVRIAEDTLNFLRFGAALQNPGIIPYAYQGPWQTVEPLLRPEAHCFISDPDHLSIAHSLPSTELAFEGLSEETLNQWERDSYWMRLTSILRTDRKTETERRALVGASWIGSAMADRYLDGRFLRLWFAVEGMVGNLSADDREKVIDNLSQRLACLVDATGKYHFDRSQTRTRRRTLCHLYGLRSKIVHAGIRHVVGQKQLTELGFLAVSGVTGLLDLSTHSIETKRQLCDHFRKLEAASIEQPNHDECQ